MERLHFLHYKTKDTQSFWSIYEKLNSNINQQNLYQYVQIKCSHFKITIKDLNFSKKFNKTIILFNKYKN